MKRSNKAVLAAGMLAGVCMLTGCASGGSAQPTPSPDVAQQQSAEPSPEASEEPAEEAPLSLTVDGKTVEPAAMEENGRLMLPLVETGEALGWTAKSEALSEETQTRRSVALTKGDSRITVTWLVRQYGQRDHVAKGRAAHSGGYAPDHAGGRRLCARRFF